MSLENIYLKPKTGTVTEFLHKHAQMLHEHESEKLEWNDIRPMMLPVLLVIAENLQFTYVLINRERFNVYHKNYSDGLLRKWYLVKIEDLWDASNINKYRHHIESDRMHSRVAKYASTNDSDVKKKLMVEVGKNLYRTKTERQIANELKLSTSHVIQMVKFLVKQGVDIPVKPKAIGTRKDGYSDTKSCLMVLQNELPEIFATKKIISTFNGTSTNVHNVTHDNKSKTNKTKAKRR